MVRRRITCLNSTRLSHESPSRSTSGPPPPSYSSHQRSNSVTYAKGGGARRSSPSNDCMIVHNIDTVVVSGKVILSAENSGRPLGGRALHRNPLGCSQRSAGPLPGGEGVAAPSQEPHPCSRRPFGLPPPMKNHGQGAPLFQLDSNGCCVFSVDAPLTWNLLRNDLRDADVPVRTVLRTLSALEALGDYLTLRLGSSCLELDEVPTSKSLTGHYPRRARSASAWVLFSLWMYVCMFVCMLAL